MASSRSLPLEVCAWSLCLGKLGELPAWQIPFPRSLPPASFPAPLTSSQSAWVSDQITDDRHSRQNNSNGGKKKKSRLFFYRALSLKGNYRSDKITANCKII